MKEHSHAQRGFISTVFLIKADLVFENLLKCEEDFEAEAYVLDAFKCMLARKEEIGDYETHGITVHVYLNSGAYELHYLDCRILVSTYDDMIVDFCLYRQ